MKPQDSTRLVGGALVFALALSLVTPPGGAADRRLAMTAQPLRDAAQAQVAVADMDRARKAQASTSAVGAGPEKPFFKTGKGITAAVLMTAGLAWLFYTKSHDRVTSPANR